MLGYGFPFPKGDRVMGFLLNLLEGTTAYQTQKDAAVKISTLSNEQVDSIIYAIHHAIIRGDDTLTKKALKDLAEDIVKDL
jgi:hypothetical protein